jgi:hypothetical protein
MSALGRNTRRFPLTARIGITGVLAVVTACSDSTSPAPPPTSRKPAPAAGTGPAVSDFATVSRFALKSVVSGDLRPGGVVAVVATIRANLATKDARLSVVTPEVELAIAKRYAPSAKLTGVPTNPRVDERALFGAGGRRAHAPCFLHGG